MKRSFASWLGRAAGWFGAALIAANLSFGQAPARPRPRPMPAPPAGTLPAPPPGVVSEQADDEAIGGVRNPRAATPATPATTATPGQSPATPATPATPANRAAASPATAPATTTAPATATTTTQPAISGAATVDAGALVASAAADPNVVSAENTRAADLGVWLNARTGVLTISDLATVGPIAGLGFQIGDRIVFVNGQPVTTEQQFLRQLLADNIRNQQIDVIVSRNGTNQTVQLQPANLIQGMVQVDPLFELGIVVDPTNSTRLIVQRVFPRTPAFHAGVRPGDILTNVGGQPVTNVTSAGRAFTLGANALPVQVNRAGRVRNLTFEPSSGMFRQRNQVGAGAAGNMLEGTPQARAAAAAGNTAINPSLAPGAPQSIGGTTNPNLVQPPPNPATTGPRGGTLFPNSAQPTPRAVAPGSTERVPVTIPGATTPAAGNPVAPGAAPGATPPGPGGGP
jgi:membrane-associated protease RseP (regulator of RpoE activity)